MFENAFVRFECWCCVRCLQRMREIFIYICVSYLNWFCYSASLLLLFGGYIICEKQDSFQIINARCTVFSWSGKVNRSHDLLLLQHCRHGIRLCDWLQMNWISTRPAIKRFWCVWMTWNRFLSIVYVSLGLCCCFFYLSVDTISVAPMCIYILYTFIDISDAISWKAIGLQLAFDYERYVFMCCVPVPKSTPNQSKWLAIDKHLNDLSSIALD